MKGGIAHLNFQSIVSIKDVNTGYLDLVDRRVRVRKNLSLSFLNINHVQNLERGGGLWMGRDLCKVQVGSTLLYLQQMGRNPDIQDNNNNKGSIFSMMFVLSHWDVYSIQYIHKVQ